MSASRRRKEKHEVGVAIATGRPTPLNRQAEDVLIDLSIWRRRSLADNGKIDPHEAIEAVPMIAEAERILGLMAPTWGQINSMLDSSQGMFGQTVQRRYRETVQRYPGNVIAFPVARDQAAGD